MAGNEKLKKENQALRNEVAELKQKLEELSVNLASKASEDTGKEAMSPGRANSVELVSEKYDELVSFKEAANKELQRISKRVNTISDACDRITKAVDDRSLELPE